jgi:hypothetical protein
VRFNAPTDKNVGEEGECSRYEDYSDNDENDPEDLMSGSCDAKL